MMKTAGIGAVSVMRSEFPPVSPDPAIVFPTQPTWGFLWFPTLVGALALVAMTLIYNNLTRETKNPKCW